MAAGTCGTMRPATTSHRTFCCSRSSACAPVKCASRRTSDRSFWGPADDGPFPTSAARREALAVRFMETAVETAPSSMATLDAPRVGRACARSPSATGSSSAHFYAELEAPRIAEDLGVTPARSARSGIGRWHACATACWDKEPRQAAPAAMNAPGCERVAFADLTDYAAGELPEAAASAIEEHLFVADCSAPRSSRCWCARSARRSNLRRSAGSDGRFPESVGARGRARADILARLRGHRPPRRGTTMS